MKLSNGKHCTGAKVDRSKQNVNSDIILSLSRQDITDIKKDTIAVSNQVVLFDIDIRKS